MIRRYILFGLIASALLPAFLHAAENRPEMRKPTLLVVYDFKQKDFDEFYAHSLKPFSERVALLAQQDFNIQSKLMENVFARDLHNVDYVLIVELAGGPSETEIIKSLQNTGLDKVANKAYVLIHTYFRGPQLTDMSNNFKRFFKDIFQLHLKDRAVYENTTEYVRFNRFLKGDLLEQLQAVQQPALQQQEQSGQARSAELTRKLNEYYTRLERLDPAMAYEFLELISQLQR